VLALTSWSDLSQLGDDPKIISTDESYWRENIPNCAARDSLVAELDQVISAAELQIATIKTATSFRPMSPSVPAAAKSHDGRMDSGEGDPLATGGASENEKSAAGSGN
jgi:hypothetical protein